MNRLLGATEHLLWLRDQRWSVNFAIATRIAGVLNPDKLSDALSWVQRKHPLLRVKISIDQQHQPEFISEGVGAIPLRVEQRQDQEHWCREVAAEIVNAFSSSEDPLLRVVLLQGQDISELIFTCHHSIGDALSVIYLIRDTLQELGNPGINRQIMSQLPSLEELLSITPSPSLLTQNGVEFHPSTREWQPSILHWSLSPNDTSKLRSRCREMGVSIQGIICASFLLSMVQKLDSATTLKCLSPLNVRNYLEPAIGEDMGVYIALPTTKHKLQADSDLWELARDVKEQLKEIVTQGKLFAAIPQMQALLATQPSPNDVYQNLLDKGLDLAVSNLGALDIPQKFGDLHLEAIYGPALLGLENVQVLGVATLGGEMFLTYTYLDSVISHSEAEAIKNTAMKYIHQAIA